MKKLIEKSPMIARLSLGLMFTVFGLNGFLGFIPMPPPESAAAGTYMGGLGAAGYFFPLLKLTQIAVGLLLLSGRLVPLALTVLAPITIHIVAFHAFLELKGIGLALAVLGLHLFLAWAYRDAFRGVLALKSVPTAPSLGQAAAAGKASPAVS